MKSKNSENCQNDPVEIAIIGGGIAGLYSAWRISSDSLNNFKVNLYESDSRLGGRIYSQEIPGVPFKAELGAMRFRQTHQILCKLLNELDIPTREFDISNPVYYIRGRRLTHSELKLGRCESCGAGIPFQLKRDEQKLSPSTLIKQAVDEAIKKLSFVGLKHNEGRRLQEKLANEDFSPDTWELVKKHGRFGNIPLYNIGFWNLLHHFLSNEAFVMLHDLLSLDSILGNWNAAEAIPWFLSDFANNEFLMIPGGTGTIIEKLREKINSEKVTIKTKSKVNSVIYEKDTGRWQLHFENGEQKSFDKVVLALPRRALEMLKIDKEGQKYPPDWVSSVRPHRMFKLFLVYENPWWITDDFPGHDEGRVYTDLPLRQVYYFSPTWMRKCYEDAKREKLKDNEHPKTWSLIMASYSDEHYVSFWNPVLSDPTLHPVTNAETKHFHLPAKLPNQFEEKLKEIPKNLLASKRMVEKVQRQLSEIHHGKDIPEPILGVYKDWGADPFAGGWHTWEVGTKPWESRKRFLRNYPNLYLCGEAYSSVQGWMESALKTAESVLKELEIPNHKWAKGQDFIDFEEYLKH